MGGDIIYRWGNPSNYGMSGNQAIPSAVHDVRWIPNDGRPNSGYLQIFNNSGNGNGQSTVDGIETPIDSINGYNYYRAPGQPFGPFSFTTRYNCQFSAPGQSASDRMSNGNIFVNASGGQGGAGVMYEVDQDENIIWGPYNSQSQKAFRYECDYPGIIALQPFMNNTLTTSCFDNVSINNFVSSKFNFFPNPTNSNLHIEFENNNYNNIQINIYNALGEYIFSHLIVNTLRVNEIVDFTNHDAGVYFLEIVGDFDRILSEPIFVIK